MILKLLFHQLPIVFNLVLLRVRFSFWSSYQSENRSKQKISISKCMGWEASSYGLNKLPNHQLDFQRFNIKLWNHRYLTCYMKYFHQTFRKLILESFSFIFLVNLVEWLGKHLKMTQELGDPVVVHSDENIWLKMHNNVNHFYNLTNQSPKQGIFKYETTSALSF